jgi:hypothetical protein
MDPMPFLEHMLVNLRSRLVIATGLPDRHEPRGLRNQRWRGTGLPSPFVADIEVRITPGAPRDHDLIAGRPVFTSSLQNCFAYLGRMNELLPKSTNPFVSNNTHTSAD